jgi:hypothetical protein
MSTVPVCQAIRRVPILLGGCGPMRPTALRRPSVPALCLPMPCVALVAPLGPGLGGSVALRCVPCNPPLVRRVSGAPR